MFVGRTIRERYPVFVDLDDLDFYKEVINYAVQHTVEQIDKESTPVAFISRLSAQTADESSIVERKLVHDSKRARRRSITLDLDFDESQQEDSDRVRNALIDIAETFNTPLLMYPTASWPTKPRYRVVLFTKGLMNAHRYEQAVRWLYGMLGLELLDQSDTRITMNRNLPLLRMDQLDAVYSTLDDESLQPLDNALWRDVDVPKRKQIVFDRIGGVEFDEHIVISVSASTIAQTPVVSSYNTIWRLIESIALAVVDDQLSLSVAEQCMDIFADVDAENATRYRVGNRELLHKSMDMLKDSVERRGSARPLESWTEFMVAVEKGE